MLTSTLCTKCQHQHITPHPKPHFYQNLNSHRQQSTPQSPEDRRSPLGQSNNVVLNLELNLKIELPKSLDENTAVVSKTLQCGGGIVFSTENSNQQPINLELNQQQVNVGLNQSPKSSSVQNLEIQTTYPIGFDENRCEHSIPPVRDISVRDTNLIRLNQVTSFERRTLPELLANIPMPISNAVCQRDLDTLSATVRVLRLSGFYYESITQEKALDLLANKKPGTFLVRNSSNPQHIFTISVQTLKGPTSVRLNYLNGYFYFDCDQSLLKKINKFNCVIKLIEHYIYATNRPATYSDMFSNSGSKQVWLDYYTRRYYSNILLVEPLRKEIPKLQHLCRSSIYKNRIQVPENSIPYSLVTYLLQYPYVV